MAIFRSAIFSNVHIFTPLVFWGKVQFYEMWEVTWPTSVSNVNFATFECVCQKMRKSVQFSLVLKSRISWKHDFFKSSAWYLGNFYMSFKYVTNRMTEPFENQKFCFWVAENWDNMEKTEFDLCLHFSNFQWNENSHVGILVHWKTFLLGVWTVISIYFGRFSCFYWNFESCFQTLGSVSKER